MNLSIVSTFAKYGGLKTAELTPAIVADITGALGLETNVSDEKFGQTVALLRENNVDGIADLVTNKGLVDKLKALFTPAEQTDENMLVCPHCSEYIQPH